MPSSSPVRLSEAERVAAVKPLLGIVEQVPPAFDRITGLAAALLNAPISLISLVDDRSQHLVSRVGTDVYETDREISFCAHAIRQNGVFTVTDAHADERFTANPLVTGAPFIRFYAGAPLKCRGGHNVGTLCIIDTEPRAPLDRREEALLVNLAAIAANLLDLYGDSAGDTALAGARLRSRLAALVADSPTAIIGCDLDGVTTDWNPAAERLLGWTAEETLGRPLPFQHDDDVAEISALRDRVLARERITGLETQRVTKSGETVDISLSLAALLDEDETPIGLLANIQDITERKQRERAEAERRSRLETCNSLLVGLAKSRGIVEGELDRALDEILTAATKGTGVARAGIWRLDPDKRVLELVRLRDPNSDAPSDLTLKAADYPAYFEAMENDRELAVVDVGRDPRTQPFLDSYLEPEGVSSLLDVPIRSRGRLVGVLCIEHKGTPRQWSVEDCSFAASVADFVALALEAEERQRTEAELRRAKASAESANRAKASFLATMGHELRTPLNGIIGFAELIEKEVMGPLGTLAYREYAENIHSSGSRLLDIMNDVLAIAQAEAESSTLQATDACDIPAAVERALASLSREIERKSIHVETQLSDSLPALDGDAGKLNRAIAHILSNAVKFTPEEGGIEITADFEKEEFALTVRDSGIGMRQEDIPRALTPFRQLDETLARSYDGIGVGLPLAKHFVELHDGRLEIDSAPGQGTSVTLRFPAERLVTDGQPQGSPQNVSSVS